MAYMVFDLLHLEGQSLVDVPLEDRKHLLRRVLRPDGLVRYASHVVGDGVDFTQAAADKGLEGIVAKRRLSPYQPGRRSRDWLKIKLRREQEIVVVGWLPGQGTHKDLGSLIVAVNDDGGLRHAGQVGSGINARMRKELLAAMEPIRRRGPAAGQEATAAAGALGRAADRDPRRVHRLDARRPAAPGRVQGDRAGPRSGQGGARRGDPGRAGRAEGATGQPPAQQAPGCGGADPPAKATAKRRRRRTRRGRRRRWTSRPPAAPS